MAGYFFSKSATSWAMSGTQAQKVSSVGVDIALSMSAWLTVVDLAEPLPPAVSAPPLLLLHAASRLSDTTPAMAASSRRRFNGGLAKNVFMKEIPVTGQR